MVTSIKSLPLIMYLFVNWLISSVCHVECMLYFKFLHSACTHACIHACSHACNFFSSFVHCVLNCLLVVYLIQCSVGSVSITNLEPGAVHTKVYSILSLL